MNCELCKPASLIAENELAYARWEGNALAAGHVIVVPRRPIPGP